jgi:hypothetical protein
MPEHTRHQQGIVRRYYEHFDTISLQRLSEAVSEIYLAEGNKPAKLWEKVKGILSRVASEDPRVAEIVAKKDIEGLARLVNELNLGLKEKRGAAPPTSGAHALRGDHLGEPNQAAAPASRAASAPLPSSVPSPPASPSDPLDPENLKRAMKAFRKRLKLTRLDDESRLGRSPMSGGKQSQVAAIMAPREFPKPVWDELVRQGKLRTHDGVFYELVE